MPCPSSNLEVPVAEIKVHGPAESTVQKPMNTKRRISGTSLNIAPSLRPEQTLPFQGEDSGEENEAAYDVPLSSAGIVDHLKECISPRLSARPCDFESELDHILQDARSKIVAAMHGGHADLKSPIGSKHHQGHLWGDGCGSTGPTLHEVHVAAHAVDSPREFDAYKDHPRLNTVPKSQVRHVETAADVHDGVRFLHVGELASGASDRRPHHEGSMPSATGTSSKRRISHHSSLGLNVGHQHSIASGFMVGLQHSLASSTEHTRRIGVSQSRERSKLQQILSSVRSRSAANLSHDHVADVRVMWRRLMDIVRVPNFEAAMGIFIILNAIVIGISTDLERGWDGWALIDGFFTLIFTVELVLKWMSYGFVFFFRRAPSAYLNWLDFILVVLAVAEVTLNIFRFIGRGGSVFVFSILRTLRLLRIGRVLRLARLPIFHELMMMLDGAKGGLRTLMWSQVLIALFVYVVALIFREMLGGNEPTGPASYFDSLAQSYFTVFRCLIANDCNDDLGRPIFVAVAKDYGWQFAATYCVASVLITFGLFNVIVAIYVENTVAAAKCNEVRMKQDRLSNKRMFDLKVQELLEFILHSGIATDGVSRSLRGMSFAELKAISISFEMLESLRNQAEFRDILRDLDVADEEHYGLFDLLDAIGSEGVDLEGLIHAISKLRGDARRSDIISVGLMVGNLQEAFAQLEQIVMKSKRPGSMRPGLTTVDSGSGLQV